MFFILFVAMMLYDMDIYSRACRSVQRNFDDYVPAGTTEEMKNKYVHCFAIKSCPVSYILHYTVKHCNFGLETASIMEMKQALRCGCPPERVVYDSPCKSSAEIRTALLCGVNINANSFVEVTKIVAEREKLEKEGLADKCTGVVGIRVNPMVGGGNISALSTATASSKFGIPLTVPGKEKILDIYRKYPYFKGIMSHVGSQGMPVSIMAKGVQILCNLADDIDAACRAEGETAGRIRLLDIGGGLSANYTSEEVSPTFGEYAAEILKVYPRFFQQGRIIATEFGKSLITKSGVICTTIEDVLTPPTQAEVQAAVAMAEKLPHSPAPASEAVPVAAADEEEKYTVIIHAGADILLRTAYCPTVFKHRFALVPAVEKNAAECAVTIAGPLCFSGDILAKDYLLPKPEEGDKLLILDTGANSISLFR